MSGQVFLFLFAPDRWKVRHLSENKSAIEWREHVVLVTWENVTRPQLPHCFRESLATIRQRDPENCKIDISYSRVWRRAGNATRVDVNSLSGRFDHKRERFAEAPIG